MNHERHVAPWKDYAGNSICEGDQIEHPSGEKGTVFFYPDGETEHDKWKVDYGSGPPSALSLQVGEKGQAVVSTQKNGGANWANL